MDLARTDGKGANSVTTECQVKAVWGDQAKLHWSMQLDQDVSLLGGTRMQASARVKRSQPQTRLLVAPLGTLDLAQGVDIYVPRGVQFWDSGTPRAYKVTNVDTSDWRLFKATPLATAYIVNDFYMPRIPSLLDPQTQLREREEHRKGKGHGRR